MILNINLNPILETIYNINNIGNKINIKSTRTVYNLGGSSLNTTQIIKKQNLDVFATGLLGGIKGQYIFEKLKELDIYNDFTYIQEDSKGETIVLEEEELLYIIEEEGPRVTRKEIRDFYQLYNNILYRTEFICGVGNLPVGVPKEIYYDLIQLAKEYGKKFILDAKNKELLYGIEAKPFMIKVDKEDLEEIAQLKLSSEEEILMVARGLVEKGIELIVIDLKESGMVVIHKDIAYRSRFSSIDTEIINIGKDRGYTIGGYAIGIGREYDIETIMKLGQAMRISYGMERDLNKVSMRDVKRIMSNIEVSIINF